MGILFKSTKEFLAEAASCETCDDTIEELLGDDILDDIEDVEELDDDIEYTEEMVNVISQESSTGATRYLVEYDNLYKLMETYNIEETEALSRVCEHNLISVADTYVVIESAQEIEEAIHEAKCVSKKSNDPMKKAFNNKKFKNTRNAIKNMKNKGIKLLKKKAKAKKRK